MPKFKFDNPEIFKQKVDEYFEVMEITNRPFTMSGLAHFLGTNRMTLLNAKNRNPEINEILNNAKARIEAYVEEQLYLNPRTAGIIFNLKNNFNWVDKQEVAVAQESKNILADMSTEEIKQLLQEPVGYIDVVSTPILEKELIKLPED